MRSQRNSRRCNSPCSHSSCGRLPAARVFVIFSVTLSSHAREEYQELLDRRTPISSKRVPEKLGLRTAGITYGYSAGPTDFQTKDPSTSRADKEQGFSPVIPFRFQLAAHCVGAAMLSDTWGLNSGGMAPCFGTPDIAALVNLRRG